MIGTTDAATPTFSSPMPQIAPSSAPATPAARDRAAGHWTERGSRDAEHVGRRLAELRAVFNRPSGGGWAILHDPWRATWVAVRGKDTTVRAASADELHELIISGRGGRR